MQLSGKRAGVANLHSDDATFCGVDVHPPEIYADPIDETRIDYTGVVVPQAEFFEGLAQWKDTADFEERIATLELILDFISKPESRAVLCFNLHTTKANGWALGSGLLNDLARTSSHIERKTALKGTRYKIQGKGFGERHAVTLFTYAFALATMFQHVAREVTKAESLASLRKHTLQFLVDNVSGDPAPGGGIQWYLDLIYFIIEESPLGPIVETGLSKSVFQRFGLTVPIASQVVGDQEIAGHNRIPLMIAADWFTKICGRHAEMSDVGIDDLAEDDGLIREIVSTLEQRQCLVRRGLPIVDLEQIERLNSAPDH